MKIILSKIAITIVTTLLFASCLIACSQDEKSPAQPSEPITVKIGYLTEMTGGIPEDPKWHTYALSEIVAYYNEHNLIPGVQFEIVKCDTQYMIDRTLSCYEKLKSEGVDFIWSNLPWTATELRSKSADDNLVVFTEVSNMQNSDLNDGYVFGFCTTPEYEVYTLLRWISENDPDFPKDKPAKIGAAAWKDDYREIWFESIIQYAESNPDQYEWVEGYLTDIKFTWSEEVEGLRYCDYVYIPIPPNTFIKNYRDEGYSAKFIGNEWHSTFVYMLDRANLWDSTSGMILVKSIPWVTDEDPLIVKAKQIFCDNHSRCSDILNEYEANYYIALAYDIQLIFELVGYTIDKVGWTNFNSETLYESSQSFSFSNGIVSHSFNAIKRTSNDDLGIYEIDATNKTLVRAETDWIPIVTTP